MFQKEEGATDIGRSFLQELDPKSVELQTRNHDDDAENEGLRVTAAPSANLTGASEVSDDVKIMDDDDQFYRFALDPKDQDLDEGDDVTVSLKADPPHVQGSTTLTLLLSSMNLDDLGYEIAISGGFTNASNRSNQVTIGSTDVGATAAVNTGEHHPSIRPWRTTRTV